MVQIDPPRTYVMAYWPVAGNAKRSLEHYSKYLSLTLEMLSGCNLHFISGNNVVLATVETLCRQNGIRLHAEKILLDDLRKRPQMDVLLARSKTFGARLVAPPADFRREKGLIHYWRDLRQSGEDIFRKIFCIWHSKIDLLHHAAQTDPFSSAEFAWVDASVSRFNNLRPAWDFRQVADVRPGVIYHYPNDMCRNGRRLPLNASFLLGDKTAITRLHSAYEEAFERCLVEDYPHDEETVLDTVIARQPELFSVISGPQQAPLAHAAPAVRTDAGGAHRKILVVGTFRSGTNAMKSCLETHFDVEVTFNEWFWKHGVPPTGIQCPVPEDVPIIVMVKSPFAFHESLYPFWQHRRPKLESGESVTAFSRKELLVFDVSGGNLARPKYWYRCPTEYWNQFYLSWLTWTEVNNRTQFVKYEDFAGDTEKAMLAIAKRFGLRRTKDDPITLPQDRVGPHVPTERSGERYVLTTEGRQWIRERVHPIIARTFGYEL